MKKPTAVNQNKTMFNFKKFEITKTQHNKIKGGNEGQSVDGDGEIIIDDDIMI